MAWKMVDILYNVLLLDQTRSPKEWQADAVSWVTLNREIAGDSPSNFNPLTLKAFYIVGIILAACKSVSLLLDDGRAYSETFYPAYGVFASAVELIGRCINGNTTASDNSKDLRTGLYWLAMPRAASYKDVPEDKVLIKTINFEYPIKDLVAFRHFCAHGQAANKSSVKEFDYHILGEMPPLIGGGMESWLIELMSNEDFAMRLAKALVTPYRNAPILNILFRYRADKQSFPASIGDELSLLSWCQVLWSKIAKRSESRTHKRQDLESQVEI